MTNISSKEEIFEILKKIILDALMIDPSKIVSEARIYDDLGAESIDMVDMRFQIEHIFGLEMEQEEMIQSLGDNIDAIDFVEKFTVGWFVDYIQEKLSQTEQAK